MIEYENVKDALKALNDEIEVRRNGETVTVKTNNEGKAHVESKQEFAESLLDRIANIADLLGMSEIYLND